MLAVAANALFTSLRRRGTTRQLAGAIVTCVVSALLLLPALVWYNLRFVGGQVLPAEVELALVYVALCGWVLPLSVTTAYFLFTLPRDTSTALHIPRQKAALPDTPAIQQGPRSQPGIVPPYVFSEETAWGWLEYRSGNFQGQRLALKRAIATIGRDEDNDIWIDDEMASRHHAELAYEQGKAYLIDCGSLNGMLLNSKRVYGTTLLKADDIIEIGEQRFSFMPIALEVAQAAQSDPLAHHIWRTSQEVSKNSNYRLPTTLPGRMNEILSVQQDETTEIDYKQAQRTQRAATNAGGVFIIRDGENTGKSFPIDRAVVSVGRSQECDVVIDDGSISRCHVQFLRQADGDYVQDLGSRNGTQINGEHLRNPRLLQAGDIIEIGNIHLEYRPVPATNTGMSNSSASGIVTPHLSSGPISSPALLKLPSRLVPPH